MSNSESTAAHKELDDLTECPICTEVFTDPRSLPCIHTYCLQCIVQWSKNGRPGDLISCPMCMKRFSIPSGGLQSLPKNFFVERLKKTAELLRGSPSIVRNLCEACGVDGVDSTSDVEIRQRASIYCIDCHQRFCDVCGDLHRKINAARTHRTVRLDVAEPVDGNSGSAEVTSALRCQRLPELMCDRHLSECLKLFCENCEDVICIMCFVESHRTHKCSDVNQVVDSFKRRMVLDVVELERGITECRGWLSELEDRKHELADAATKIESEIDERTEALKRLIDDKKMKLRKELTAIRSKKLAQLGDVVQMIDQRRLLMDGLRKYNEELANKGAASDIARQTNALHNSTEEFLNFDDLRRQMSDLNASGLIFMSSNFSSLNNGVSIGKVQLQKTVDS